MSEERVDLVEILRAARRSAGDMRKVLLSLYGLLITVPMALLVVAAARSALFEGFGWTPTILPRPKPPEMWTSTPAIM